MNSDSSSKHSSWWGRKLSQQKTPSDPGQSSTRRGVLQALRPGSLKTATAKDYAAPGSTSSVDGASSRGPTVTITSSPILSPTVKTFDDNQDPHRRSKLRESDSLLGRYKRSPAISSDALSKTVVHHTLVSPSQSSALPIDSTKGERRRRSHTTATSVPSHPSPRVETCPPSPSVGPSSSSQQDPRRSAPNFGTLPPKNNSDIRLHVSRAPSYSLSGRERITNSTQNITPVITAVPPVSAPVPKFHPLSSPSSLENIRRSPQTPEQSITSAAGGWTPPTFFNSIASMQSPSSLSFSSSTSGDSLHVRDISPLALDSSPEAGPSSPEFTFAERPLPSSIDPTISYRSPARPQTAPDFEAELSFRSYASVLPSFPAKPGKLPSNREESSPSSSPARNSGSKWNNVLKRQKSLAPASHHLDVEHPLRHYSSFSSPGPVVLREGASSSSSVPVGLSVSCASSPSPGSPTSATNNLIALTDSKGGDVVSKRLVGPTIEPMSTSQIEGTLSILSRHGRGASVGAIDGISQPVVPSHSSGIGAPVVEPLGTVANSLGMHILPPSEMERVLQAARTSEDGHCDLDSPKAKLGVNAAPMSPTLSARSYSDRTSMLRRISESPSTPPIFISSLSLSRPSSVVGKDGKNHVYQRPSTGGGIASFGGQPIITSANAVPQVHSLPPPPRRSHTRTPRTPPPADRPRSRQVISTVSVGPSPPAILEEAPAGLPSDGYRSWGGSNKNKPSERVRRISATSGSTITTAVSAEDFPEPAKAIISVTSSSMGAARTRSILKRPSFLDISSETDEAEPANFLELDNRPSLDCGR